MQEREEDRILLLLTLYQNNLGNESAQAPAVWNKHVEILHSWFMAFHVSAFLFIFNNSDRFAWNLLFVSILQLLFNSLQNTNR